MTNDYRQRTIEYSVKTHSIKLKMKKQPKLIACFCLSAALSIALSSNHAVSAKELSGKLNTPLQTPVQLAQRQTNIEGIWNISEGKNPDGEEYTGTLEIKATGTVDNLYNVTWKTSAGTYNGLGLYENGRLFVGWAPVGEIYGLILYRISKDGILQGEWTYSGARGKVWQETATPDKKDDLEGEYQTSGRDSGGEYNGNLTINKSGETYQLTWKTDNDSYSGVGIRTGDWLAVGWGPTENLGVLEYEINGNEAKGRWAIPNISELGTDNINRRTN